MIKGLLIAVLAIAITAVGVAQNREPREDPNSGRLLYRTYCASCHGVDGRGGGPAASTLRLPPPDLTLIQERHGGNFPANEIAQIIDGRKPLAAHTDTEMPRWGRILGIMEMNNEAAIKERVLALVAYLESLQRRR